jgi:hypothetical protein
MDHRHLGPVLAGAHKDATGGRDVWLFVPDLEVVAGYRWRVRTRLRIAG